MAKNIDKIGKQFAEGCGVKLGSVSDGVLRNAQRQFAKDGDVSAAVRAIAQVTASAGYHPTASDIRRLESMLK